MNDTFLKACLGEKTDYNPVWIMRQAGRSLPQFRKVMERSDFLAMCKTPEIAADVTIQPVEVLGVDAAILFSDILTTVEPMGMQLECRDGGKLFFNNSIRGAEDVCRLCVPDPEESLSFVIETVKILAMELQNRVPLIGFAGTPFTLAAYMIEGIEILKSSAFINTRKMISTAPQLFNELLDKVTAMTVAFLKSQIKAGANAVMLFDSRADLLCPRDYYEFSLPSVTQIISSLKTDHVPIIYYVNGCAGLLDKIRECGADVIGIDSRVEIDSAIKQLGDNISVQGNLNPFVLFMSRSKIEDRVKDILDKASNARGHIFNLGGGLHSETPLENIIALIEAVHSGQ